MFLVVSDGVIVRCRLNKTQTFMKTTFSMENVQLALSQSSSAIIQDESQRKIIALHSYIM